MPNFPTGWCCYVLLRSDGSYDCGITSNLTEHIRGNGFGEIPGNAPQEQPIALVWYESTRERRSAATRQQQIKSWSEGQNRKRAGKCVPFEGIGNNVWIPLASTTSPAK